MDLRQYKGISIGGVELKKLAIDGVEIWRKRYTNWVPKSIDTDGSIYDGDGWIAKKRLSSSGVLKDVDYTSATGFIPAKANDVVRIGGCYWMNTVEQSTNYVCSYDANFNFIKAVNCLGGYGGGTVSGDENVAVVKLLNNTSIAYIRVSAKDDTYTEINGPGAQMIVTINEEIT